MVFLMFEENTPHCFAPADLLRRQVNRCFRGWTSHWLTSVSGPRGFPRGVSKEKLKAIVMRGAAVVGNNAVVTGEGQVVQLDVGAEHDALADRVNRTGVVE